MSETLGSTRLRARALMERVLRDGAPLDGEYPLCFRDGFPGDVVTVEEAGEVRSACAVLVRELCAGPETVRVGLIGSVSTDPGWRGRGLATRVLERAEARLREEGCTLALLWADEAAFYLRRGFLEAGAELIWALEEGERLPWAAGAVVRAAAPDDFGALHRLYELHRSRTQRTADETRALLSGPGIATLVLERGQDIAAYACLGRGQDLARCVHEWSGAPDDVLALGREHARRLAQRGDAGPVFLMAPPSATSMRARLEALGARGVCGILGLAKLLDPAEAAEIVRRAARRGDLHSGMTSQRDGPLTRHRAVLRGPSCELELDERDLLALLLPPRGERDTIEARERALGVELPGLPLPLYAWGLDSI